MGRWWWVWWVGAALVLELPGAHSFTLDAYFKVLSVAAKKRDILRKIFFGYDIGFRASPWLFRDRVAPPYVPIITSFPKTGRYRSEGPRYYYPDPSHYSYRRRRMKAARASP